jgi:membrane-associated phospholipid phosphatase
MKDATAASALRPVDRLLAAYNAALALAWLAAAALAGPTSSGPGLAYEIAARVALALSLVHVICVGLPWVIARLPAEAPLPLRLLRTAYPLLFVPICWLELDPLIRTLHATTWDGTVMALDRVLFGLHLDQAWIRAVPQLWFSEIMYFAYWLYLPIIFLPPIVMAIRRDTAGFDDVTLRLLATYLGCYMFYILLPTAGPAVFGRPFASPSSHGFFYQLVARAHETGNVYGAAFPSSHVAGAVTVAWLGWRWFPRWAAILLTVQAAGVVMSTVYTQNHYAVDSLAGVFFALAIQAWAVPALRRRAGRRRAPRSDIVSSGWSTSRPS